MSEPNCGCNLNTNLPENCEENAITCCLPEILAYDLDKLVDD